jgi:uronate dehydrogenase
MLATWLSFDDLHRLITACLTTPVLGHSIVFGMSDNAVTWWDNSRARHIGYVPKTAPTSSARRSTPARPRLT